VDNDIIANVTVTWLDKEEELWELRLFQDANGTPELENYRASVLNRRELQAKGGSKGGLKTQKSINNSKNR
jgi:hypothetical protein